MTTTEPIMDVQTYLNRQKSETRTSHPHRSLRLGCGTV
jgi:hypothetical protein